MHIPFHLSQSCNLHHHLGKVPVDLGQNASPAIYYDPDSADDMDDEDPDEDLDF